MRPEIAIIDCNTLAVMGLRSIIEDFIPEVAVKSFLSFEELIDDTPDMYVHYFVSSDIYFEHVPFFLERKHKTIVLTIGEMPSCAGVTCLNVCQPQAKMMAQLILMHNEGHSPQNNGFSHMMNENDDILSARELDVLKLVVKGYINKEIATKLNIALATVITHRKHITKKLGMKSVSSLTTYAVMHGYVSLHEI